MAIFEPTLVTGTSGQLGKLVINHLLTTLAISPEVSWLAPSAPRNSKSWRTNGYLMSLHANSRTINALTTPWHVVWIARCLHGVHSLWSIVVLSCIDSLALSNQTHLHTDTVKSIQIWSCQSNRIDFANRFENRLANQTALKYIFSQSYALQ